MNSRGLSGVTNLPPIAVEWPRKVKRTLVLAPLVFVTLRPRSFCNSTSDVTAGGAEPPQNARETRSP
jgi:hypothetical protein